MPSKTWCAGAIQGTQGELWIGKREGQGLPCVGVQKTLPSRYRASRLRAVPCYCSSAAIAAGEDETAIGAVVARNGDMYLRLLSGREYSTGRTQAGAG